MVSEAKIQPYEIVSVHQSEAPSGATGRDWHHYEIVQGANTIHGYRRGKLNAVTKAVEEMVAQLNERQRGKRGRVHLTPSSEKKKKAGG